MHKYSKIPLESKQNVYIYFIFVINLASVPQRTPNDFNYDRKLKLKV